MNEAGFIKKVHGKLDRQIYKCKFADRFTSGLPDCWYSGTNSDIWVEYKYSEYPLRKPALTKHQMRWLKERHEQGRNVAVTVGSPDKSIVIVYKGINWLTPFKSLVLTFTEYIHWLEGEVA